MTKKKTTVAADGGSMADLDEVDLREVKHELSRDVFVDPDPVRPEDAVAELSGAHQTLTPSGRHLAAVERVREKVDTSGPLENQAAIAEVLELMGAIAVSANAGPRMAMADLALEQLLRSTGEPVLAQRIIKDLRKDLGGRLGLWFTRVRVRTPPQVDVLLGLTISLLFLGLVLVAGGPWLVRALGLPVDVVDETTLRELFWIGAIGAVGAAVSILTRLKRDFMKDLGVGLSMHFLTGLAKPVIGFTTAQLLYTLLKAKFLNLPFDPDYQFYAYMGLAFVAGFSERMVNDLVAITERSVNAAGERTVELAGMTPAERAAHEAEKAEIHKDLSGATELSREELYASFDLNELEEEVKNTGGPADSPPLRHMPDGS